MAAGIVEITVKDSTGASRSFLAWSSTGDLTLATGNLSSLSTLQDGAGNVVQPASHADVAAVTAAVATVAAAAAAPRAGLPIVATPNAEAALILKNAPGELTGIDVLAPGAAGYLMLFDAVAAPANGAVQPKKAWPVPANAAERWAFNPPLAFATGIVAVFSSTGPFVLTGTPAAFMSGEAL